MDRKKKKIVSLNGIDVGKKFHTLKTDLQMTSARMDYIKYHSFKSSRLDKKKFTFLIVCHTHLQCLINI